MFTQDITPDPAALLNERQVADISGMSVSALRAWRLRGGGPLYAKLGSAVRYRRADVDKWIEGNLVKSTSDAGTD